MTLGHAVLNHEFVETEESDYHAFAEGRPKASGGTVYYGVPGLRFTSVTTNPFVANRLRYNPPFVVPTTVIVDQFVGEVTTAGGAGTVARFGIYRANRDLNPTTLVVDAGTIPTDSTGVKTITLGTPVTLVPGLYIAAAHSNGAATVRIWASPGPIVNNALGTNFVVGSFVDTPYVPLASTAVAPTTAATSSIATYAWFLLRVSTP